MASNFYNIKNGLIVPAGSSNEPTVTTTEDENTGLFFPATNSLSIATDGVERFRFTNSSLASSNSNGALISTSAASSFVPTIVPNKGSLTTGMGSHANGSISLIALGSEIIRIGSSGASFVGSSTLTLAVAPSLDFHAATKKYVDDTVSNSVIPSVIAGDGLVFSGGAYNVVSASNSRIVVNPDSVDLALTGVSAGTYQSLTVDTYGRVTSAASLNSLSTASVISTTDIIMIGETASSFSPKKATLSSFISSLNLVTTSRTISTTLPLSGGGDLSANRTISFNINGLTDTAVSGTDEIALADQSNSFGIIKRTLASIITDLGIWTSNNDGSGSGLDADTLDGNDSSYFAASSHNQAWSTITSTPTTLSGYGITDALSNSTSSTQSGYFGDIFLYDDSTPSHYLQITNSANLSAARVLSLNVNDADRTVSLSGNLTVSSAATISGTNTGDQTITLTGDVTGTGTGSFATTIANNSVSNAKLAQVATSTFKGRTTAGTGNVEDLTATQATALLNEFTSSLKGLAPASGGGTTNFLRADGTWAAPPGGGGGGNAFGTVSVTGQSDVIAESSNDTLNIEAGDNITITTNATSDTITISATGSENTQIFTTITEDYIISTTDDVVISNASDSITVTLPDASTVKSYYIQNAGVSMMTVATINNQLINGSDSLTLQFYGSSCRLISTGSNYLIF